MKNRIVEEKFIFSIDYLNKKLPDELLYKISTFLQFICIKPVNDRKLTIKKKYLSNMDMKN